MNENTPSIHKSQENLEPTNISLTQRIAIVITVGVILIALIGLFGWISDNRSLTSIQSSYIPIAPSTAISFLLLGAILLTHFFVPLRGSKATAALLLVSYLFLGR